MQEVDMQKLSISVALASMFMGSTTAYACVVCHDDFQVVNERKVAPPYCHTLGRHVSDAGMQNNTGFRGELAENESCRRYLPSVGKTVEVPCEPSTLPGNSEGIKQPEPKAEGKVETVDSLKDFTGIWAHSEADCEKKMSGALDKGDMDRVQTSSYELVGICENGLDMLYQPVNCGASEIIKEEDMIKFRAACRIKDYVSDKPERVLLKAEGKDDILFADPNFMVFGRYVRCSQTYTCEKAWNQ
jgi:hypothetical protein